MLKPTKVVVLDDYQGAAASLADWFRIGCSVEFVREHLDPQAGLAERLRGVAIVATMRERTRFDKTLLESLPDLEFIAATGTPRSQTFVDADAATALGIAIATTGDNREPEPSATAELTLGLILATMRQIVSGDRALRQGIWQAEFGVRLHGKTLGILGLGRIGAEVARLSMAFGMTPIAWSPHLTPQRALAGGARWVSREELFRASDVISIHLRLSDDTAGIVGAEELHRMKRTAFLVNTSRGPLVREAELVEALRSRRIAGAALDVFDREPLSRDHPLVKLHSVVLTPHIGYVVEEQLRDFYVHTVENIAAYLRGTPLRLLNPDALRVARPRPAFRSSTV